jgi:hypothetical protein
VDGAEHQVVAFGFQDYACGEDVPEVFGDDVGGEEVYFFDGVAAAAAVGFEGAEVSVAQAVAAGFDLHAEQAASVLEAYVVGGGISPGLGDVEAFAQGLRHELEFDPLAAFFEVAETFALCHVRMCPCFWGKKKARLLAAPCVC